MNYVDGFVIPVPLARMDEYKKLAKLSAKVWLRCGALAYNEGIADDVKPGKTTSFPQSVKLKEGETVIFAWALYKSRKHRDKVMAKVMADPLMANMTPANMPFDGKRMFFGGFKMIIEKS